MTSDQFARLCQAVEPFQTEYVEIQTEDLRALIDDWNKAYALLESFYHNPHKCAFHNTTIAEFLE